MRTIVCLALLLATPVFGQAAEQKPAVPPEQIAELIRQLDGADMASRVRAKSAYQKLQKIGKPAVPQLLDAMKHKSPWVRLWAGAALAGMGEPGAIEPLLKMLKDPNVNARMIATYHISGFHNRDPRIAPAIARQAADPSPDVRKWTGRALARIKFKGAIPELEKLTHSDSPDARTTAFTLLLNHRSKNKPLDIRRAIDAEEDWRVRSAAVRAIGEGVINEVAQAFDLLLHALDDAHDEVKADAVEVLNHVLKETMRDLPEKLRDRVLGSLDKKLPPLLDAELPRLRGATLYLLAAGQKEKLYPRALKALDDPSPVMRVYGFQALGRCGRKTKEVALKAVENLEHEDEAVRAAAFAALRWVTGARIDYDPKADPAKRARMVRNIRERLKDARQ